MNVHKNARLTPFGRERVVKQVLERVLTPAAASAAAGVSLRTIHKWLSRFRNEGVDFPAWGLTPVSGRFPFFLTDTFRIHTRNHLGRARA
jgi:hypothetical protein